MLCRSSPTGRVQGAAKQARPSSLPLPVSRLQLKPARLAVAARASKPVESDQPCHMPTRRAALLGAMLMVLPLQQAKAANAAPSDLAQGVSNWLNIATSYLSSWINGRLQRTLQHEGRRPDQRFGDIAVPGSFTFLHGILTGGLVVALITYDKMVGNSEAQRQGQTAHSRRSRTQQSAFADAVATSSVSMNGSGPSINPRVEAALHELIARPSTAAFSDPAVHCAFEDIRADIRNIAKYSNNAVVMQAFEELLEIEGILEQMEKL